MRYCLGCATADGRRQTVAPTGRAGLGRSGQYQIVDAPASYKRPRSTSGPVLAPLLCRGLSPRAAGRFLADKRELELARSVLAAGGFHSYTKSAYALGAERVRSYAILYADQCILSLWCKVLELTVRNCVLRHVVIHACEGAGGRSVARRLGLVRAPSADRSSRGACRDVLPVEHVLRGAPVRASGSPVERCGEPLGGCEPGRDREIYRCRNESRSFAGESDRGSMIG